jgi:hypothetical protein
MLEITVDADDVNFKDYKGEPDAAKVPDAENSASTLTLVAWQCTKSVKTNWYWHVWSKGFWPESDLEVFHQEEWPIRSLSHSSGMDLLVDKPSINSFVGTFKEALNEKLDINN